MNTGDSEVHIAFNVPARMRDGTVLLANVFTPAGNGPFPVALSRTPYSKDLVTSFPYLDPVRLAQSGFIVVVQDVRGRYTSAGDWALFANEAEDGYDTVEWAATLPGASGDVGMWGISYLGYCQWAAASMAPPHLKAIMPALTWSDARQGMFWRGGALELGMLAQLLLSSLGWDVLHKRLKQASEGSIAQFFDSFVRTVDGLPVDGYASLPLRDFGPLKRLELGCDLLDDLVGHPCGTKFGSFPYSVSQMARNTQVPAYNIGGWYDPFLKGTLDNYNLQGAAIGTASPSAPKLLVGPWSHLNYSNVVGEVDFGARGQMALMPGDVDMVELTRRWFDACLKGDDNGIHDEPPVKLFVMGANAWREEWEWPLTRTRYTPYYLQPDGELSTAVPPSGGSPDTYVYHPAHPAPCTGGSTLLAPLYCPGARDQRAVEARSDVLSYTTRVLPDPIEVTGPVTVQLWAATSARDTDFVARLADVHPDGRSICLTDGILRASFHQPDCYSPAESDCPCRLEIDLWATSNVFLPGHRIRLDVTSSCFPRWDRNPNTGEAFGVSETLLPARQLIFHDADHPSHVMLPIVGR